jgi:hypothetical protein
MSAPHHRSTDRSRSRADNARSWPNAELTAIPPSAVRAGREQPDTVPGRDVTSIRGTTPGREDDTRHPIALAGGLQRDHESSQEADTDERRKPHVMADHERAWIIEPIAPSDTKIRAVGDNKMLPQEVSPHYEVRGQR